MLSLIFPKSLNWAYTIFPASSASHSLYGVDEEEDEDAGVGLRILSTSDLERVSIVRPEAVICLPVTGYSVPSVLIKAISSR